ncbi:DUF4245 domain-containing protein [Actinomadura hibisca]|uniref:DUF4245 domain-containing protein n=1 Tax=Actinomadura hibisca TaxID=68565 RepID=UPI0009FE49B1|nr:DUF4245 domain-containing protein [Actinomadura hibisca]
MSDKTSDPTAQPAAGPAEPVSEATAVRAEAPAEQAAPADPRGTVQVTPGVYKRLTTGLGGFTLAMGACLLLVAVIYAVTPRSTEEVLPTVDYQSQLWAMRNDAPYTVHAPEGLPAGWRPTSSRLTGLGKPGEPVAWHLGFVTPTDQYAALEQSNEKASEYVKRMTNNKNSSGTQQVAGQTWTRYFRKDKKQNSLARTLPDGVSLVVAGTASYEELAVLAASLKPQAKGGAPVPTPGS